MRLLSFFRRVEGQSWRLKVRPPFRDDIFEIETGNIFTKNWADSQNKNLLQSQQIS